MEEKITRICWNEYGWQKPSGIVGKSKNKKSFECKTRYGHEEWLLDTEKIVKGFHYAFLQSIGKHHKKYNGEILNISFYSINSASKSSRFLIGKCKNLHVISENESSAIYSLYKQKGWLKEMAEQLKMVGADYKQFLSLSPATFFNIKYKPSDLDLRDLPQNFSKDDNVIKATYYNVLLNKKNEPKLEIPLSEEEDGEFRFKAGHKLKTKSIKIHYKEREADSNPFHDRMQENVYKQLNKIYPNNVGTELRGVDLIIQDKRGSYIFYEFKTSNSLKKCIREALSQLLEYAYYPNAKRAVKLIIVSQNIADSKTKKYLEKIRKEFGIPVFYRRYNPEICELESVYY